MAKHAERLGQTPLREGVGREAGVHYRHGAGEPSVGQVRVVVAELETGQHAFVDDVAGGERTDVTVLSEALDMLPDAV